VVVLGIGGAVIAALGLFQASLGTERLFGLVPAKGGHFASFGYPNHAAAFLVFAACCCAGLFAEACLAPANGRRLSRLLGWSLALALCVAAVHASRSRAGILASWLACAATVFILVRASWHRFRPAGRVDLILAGIVLALAVVLLGGRSMLHEFRKGRLPRSASGGDWLGDRLVLADHAVRMMKDHPWFGTGGWGFRHLLPVYAPAERLKWTRVPGRANVHCDPLQFASEFGLLGVALLLACLCLLIRPVLALTLGAQDALALLCGLGLLLIAGHSLIDLPFRHPAILAAWGVHLALLPKLAGRPSA
jgi:O-antigen ligase